MRHVLTVEGGPCYRVVAVVREPISIPFAGPDAWRECYRLVRAIRAVERYRSELRRQVCGFEEPNYAAFSIPFATLPTETIIWGPRYRAGMDAEGNITLTREEDLPSTPEAALQ